MEDGPRRNALGQPIGRAVSDWEARPRPQAGRLDGLRCWLEPLVADRHAAELHRAYLENRDGSNWTYLPYGPFETEGAYHEWVAQVEAGEEPLFYAIVDRPSERAVGVAAYLRIFPEFGSIEVGHLSFAPALQRTATSTEAMYLMMQHVFDELGYRRYEWKCDSLNAPSLAAARRLGFRDEGTFRNHLVMKGRNRDTHWLSITDDEWPGIRAALEAWLDPGNFDAQGRQSRSLSDWMAETLDEDAQAGSTERR